MRKEDEAVWAFLEKEVPYTNTKPWLEWQEECNRLGGHAPAVFLEALRSGPSQFHYSALLGLRIFGYEAWGDGYGPTQTYRVRVPGGMEWEHINPIHKPAVPDWKNMGKEGWLDDLRPDKP